MSKKYKAVPKRIVGVKLSKKMRKRLAPLRTFSESQLGSAILAQTLISGAKGVLTSEKVRDSVAEAGRDLQRMAMVAAARLGAVASAAHEAATTPAPSEPRRDGSRLRRVESDATDLPH